jgi:hypothetical protein
MTERVRSILTVWTITIFYFTLSTIVYAEEVITGQETTDNYLPTISEFERSGGTSAGTGNGCPSGSFCTSGTSQGGGTYSSTFDLEEQMSVDDINRGFKIDYSVGVTAHPSNASLSSCVDGNVLQSGDCRDIFRVTLSLFSAGNILEHRFVDEIELDFAGLRNFQFEQNIPENQFSALTGGIDLFGIDAGFPSGFFGPRFSDPTLSTTFDVVSFIETQVVDIISSIDVISNNPVTSIEVDLAPPTVQPETVEAEVEIEAEFEQGLQLASIEVSSPMAQMPQESTQEEATIEQEVEAEVETEIEQEVQTEETTASDNAANTEEANETEEPSPKPKVSVKKAVREKVAKQILKKMGASGRYEASNQIRTLVVMQVLANSKSFFQEKIKLQDTPGFFQNTKIPDTVINDNNFAQYVLFGTSSQQHDNLVNLQWPKSNLVVLNSGAAK